MPYRWIVFLHVVSAVVFVGFHGASFFVFDWARKQRDRSHILGAFQFSAWTVTGAYVSLAATLGTGIWLGFARSRLFSQPWYWLSLGLLLAMTVLMFVTAKPLADRTRAAFELRPSGVPRVSDDELTQILRSPRTHVTSAIGFIGLVAILYLMVLQPEFGGADEAPNPLGTQPPGSATTTLTEETSAGVDEGAALLIAGKRIYEVTVGCAECHGDDGRGTDDAPEIAGASKSAIRDALDEERDMRDIVLSEEDLEAVYQYVQTLP